MYRYQDPAMDHPGMTVAPGKETVILTFHCDDGPGIEDWVAHLDDKEVEWLCASLMAAKVMRGLTPPAPSR